MTNEMYGSKPNYPLEGSDWTEENWRDLLEELISEKIINWREVTATILGSINPSQVGTSIASKKSFQRRFDQRKCWAAVRSWHFLQNGRCVDCGTRADLQADHAIPKEFVGAIGEEIRKDFPDLQVPDSLEVVVEIEKRLKARLAASNYGGIQDELIAVISADLYGALKNGTTDLKELASTADVLGNMVLRCRRHNVVRRPSHAKGGPLVIPCGA